MKAAELFLRGLESPEGVEDIIDDRLDSRLLYVMHMYAELISKKKVNLGIKDEELVRSAMIIGYLLKGHMDRYELEKALNAAESE